MLIIINSKATHQFWKSSSLLLDIMHTTITMRTFLEKIVNQLIQSPYKIDKVTKWLICHNELMNEGSVILFST